MPSDLEPLPSLILEQAARLAKRDELSGPFQPSGLRTGDVRTGLNDSACLTALFGTSVRGGWDIGNLSGCHMSARYNSAQLSSRASDQDQRPAMYKTSPHSSAILADN